MDEPCRFEGRGGASGPAAAVVTRASVGARTARAAGVAAFGWAFGLATLPVPGLHLVSWVVPVGATAMAVWLFRARDRIDGVRGPCPTCAAPIEVGAIGYVGDDELWIRCDRCSAPWVVRFTDVRGPPAQR